MSSNYITNNLHKKGHVLSVGTICFEDIGSALAERVGQGEVGWYHLEGDSAWWLLQMTVHVCVAASCRKALVNARWVFLAQTGLKNTPFAL